MVFEIEHTTVYRYSRPVHLEPHAIRLRPRSDAWQRLHSFRLDVEPDCLGRCEVNELDGNVVTRVWFAEPVEQLRVKTRSIVETFCANPFDYLPAGNGCFPVDYENTPQLRAYRETGAISATAQLLAREVRIEWKESLIDFLVALNKRLHESIEVVVREEGDPWPSERTWKARRGACRDVAVLFMDVARAAGFAARFVSGYQAGDPESDERHLHAWAEIYVPGGGWRGFDPTHGLAVCDAHVAVAAAAFAEDAAPITGTFRGTGATSTMAYMLRVVTAFPNAVR